MRTESSTLSSEDSPEFPECLPLSADLSILTNKVKKRIPRKCARCRRYAYSGMHHCNSSSRALKPQKQNLLYRIYTQFI